MPGDVLGDMGDVLVMGVCGPDASDAAIWWPTCVKVLREACDTTEALSSLPSISKRSP
jgi:hypothetical protein